MIIHFTTVHERDDSRSRRKETGALRQAFGPDVALYVQDGLGDEIDEHGGFPIVDTGPRMRRIPRMTVGAWRMTAAILRARPRVAHFHDPELLPWGILLALTGIKVVYDVHEDVPRQVQHNMRLPQWARRLSPPFISAAEWIGARLIAGIVAATPVIAARFPTEKTALVRNYPLVDELHTPAATPMRERPLEFTYIGMITGNRNIFRMIEAVAQLPYPEARFRLAGLFSSDADRAQAEAMPGWGRVKFEGWATREGVASILADARAGLVLLKPVPHEMLTLPIKLFEYMAAGLPVISSDFPVWREIVAGSDCGLLVDPDDTDAIVRAMQWIIEHPEEAQAMGERGRRAVLERYNWDLEAVTLVDFYRDRLGYRATAGANE